jgi:hypothetical protein
MTSIKKGFGHLWLIVSAFFVIIIIIIISFGELDRKWVV